MGNLFDLFRGRKPSSSQVAKERLQLVLVHDRSNLTPAQVAAMKDEILAVIAKYVDFDPEAVEIDLTSENRQNMLTAEIPLAAPGGSSTRRRRGPAQSPLSDA
jgi:cell division topological specificity factor